MTGDAVDVWLIRTDLPDPLLSGLESLLDADELRRARALRLAADRDHFVAAHGAARLIIGRRLGAPPAQLRWRHGPHGKPELAGAWTGAQVSLSHSGEFTALAMTGQRRVGVDVQRLLTGLDVIAMSTRFYLPAEARYVAAASEPAGQVSRFVRLWTRKEARVKVTGGRLIPGLRLPALDPAALDPAGRDRDEEGASDVIMNDPAGRPPAGCLVRDVSAPRGCLAAVALEGTLPYHVTLRRWPGDRADHRERLSAAAG